MVEGANEVIDHPELNKIYLGDCLETMRQWPDEFIDCVVTSPPYWQLRDYGSEKQFGLEDSFEDYINQQVVVFDEVKRILRQGGTLWLNMGDSYRGGGCGGGGPLQITNKGTKLGKKIPPPGVSPKNLIGQPWKLAFALQESGWILRMDNIWSKPNPMPESTKDRCTRSHEYVFHFAKSERYFYDAEAIKVPVSGNPDSKDFVDRKSPSGWDTVAVRRDKKRGRYDKQKRAYETKKIEPSLTKNCRSVWNMPTQPFPAAHFATFPEWLVERCLRAGVSEGGYCGYCALAYVRILEESEVSIEYKRKCGSDESGKYRGEAKKNYKAGRAETPGEVKSRILSGMKKRETVGWAKPCSCFAGGKDIGTVFDPYSGSGTVAVVGKKLGLNFLGCELNPEYIAIANKRLQNESRLF